MDEQNKTAEATETEEPATEKKPATATDAKADKKNTGNNQIVMAVAKQKGVWALLSLPFDEYEKTVIRIAKEL